uniref:Uncharacterized protein n=1 Tax=Anguilla anguilla TaxID=7936 RepID=A0A0E9SB10_ANGAN
MLAGASVMTDDACMNCPRQMFFLFIYFPLNTLNLWGIGKEHQY